MPTANFIGILSAEGGSACQEPKCWSIGNVCCMKDQRVSRIIMRSYHPEASDIESKFKDTRAVVQ